MSKYRTEVTTRETKYKTTIRDAQITGIKRGEASATRWADGTVSLFVANADNGGEVPFDDAADALAFCDALKAAVLAIEPGASQQPVRCGHCGAQPRPDGTWWKLVPMPKEPQ